MDLPDCLHTTGPTSLENLFDGLMFNPDSLYRAWLLEHEPPDMPSRDKEHGYSWLGWSQDSMLRLDERNLLETIRVTVARIAGDKKSQPRFAYPPGVERKPEKDRSTLDMAEATADSMRMFLMGVR